jgi:hypothetical protein
MLNGEVSLHRKAASDAAPWVTSGLAGKVAYRLTRVLLLDRLFQYMS